MDEQKPHYRQYTEEFKLEALELLKGTWASRLDYWRSGVIATK